MFNEIRTYLKQRFPAANELVYDYGKSLVISYTENEKGYQGFVALSADARGIRFFFQSAIPIPDPHKLLQGSGKLARFIPIQSISDLLKPEVEALLQATIKHLPNHPSASGYGNVIIKSSKKKK